MTDETKKLFDAPWKVDELKFIQNAKHKYLAFGDEKEVVNRLARLPELYDKLMWAVVQHCPDAFLTLDECRLCPDKKCKYREIIELLWKVRNGK